MRTSIAVLVLAALGGCAEAPSPQLAPDEAPPGVLRGVVVDPSIQPLADAQVTIQPGGHTNRSDAEGIFEFRGLEPGAYTLTVSLEGYLNETVVATISAGPNPVVKIILPVDVDAQSYSTAFHFRGHFECGVWPTNGCANINIITWIVLCQYGVCLGNVTQDRSVALQWLDRVPDFLQSEMVWTSTQPAGDALFFVLGGANGEELSRGIAPAYNWTEGESSLMLTLPGQTLQEASIGNERALLIQVSSSVGVPIPGGCVVADPCGPGVQLFQDYEVFTHTFHGYQPPPEWRFTEHGAPPPPP